MTAEVRFWFDEEGRAFVIEGSGVYVGGQLTPFVEWLAERMELKQDSAGVKNTPVLHMALAELDAPGSLLTRAREARLRALEAFHAAAPNAYKDFIRPRAS